MNFSQFLRGSPVVENLGSMTAATPCPDEDAIVRFILIPEFGGRVLNQLEATSDTMLRHNESTTKPKMDATFYYPTPRHAGASYNNA